MRDASNNFIFKTCGQEIIPFSWHLQYRLWFCISFLHYNSRKYSIKMSWTKKNRSQSRQSNITCSRDTTRIITTNEKHVYSQKKKKKLFDILFTN